MAEVLVAARTIPGRTILATEDVAVVEGSGPGTLSAPEQAIGLEALVHIYAGRPIRSEDLGAPTLVDRNQIVTMIFTRGPLAIRTEGRALGRAGTGEPVRVMNLASRTTVTGTVQSDGTILVSATDPSRTEIGR